MNKIEVSVIDSHNDPGGMMMSLAKLTQRGHSIQDMRDLYEMLKDSAQPSDKTVKRVAALPHGTIKRFCPITVAIVGASRRFLAQARTHQVGFNYVSASLQYSDYTDKAHFVVPYAILEADDDNNRQAYIFAHDCKGSVDEDSLNPYSKQYLESCQASMDTYRELAEATDNDTAGYAAPQGLRNILIMQGNHEAWMNFIRLRSCNRNTVETQYVTLLIWEELLKTTNGKEFFAYAGPDCMFGRCREGKMSCGKPLMPSDNDASTPRRIIDEKWPLLKEVQE